MASGGGLEKACGYCKVPGEDAHEYESARLMMANIFSY
jgi:hypothetical protein